jgi:murein DD-endopeptidase MepM/ murein hydrolase activator NlpD
MSMSDRSRKQHFRADSGRVVRAEAKRHAAGRTEYTLAHAGRQVRLGPVTFWIAVGSLVIMAGWSLATGTYFAFHDNVLTRLIARQKLQQFAYEDRIAELRAQIDRIASRQLLDQEQFEQKLEQISRRQATLESRTSSISGMPDQTPTGSIRARPVPLPDPRREAPLKPSPLSDTVTFTPPPDREARLQSRATSAKSSQIAAVSNPAEAGVKRALLRLQTSLDRVETQQTAVLNTLEERFDYKTKHMRGVLADLGLNSKKISAPLAATGGPFVPLRLPRDATNFERQLYRVNVARSGYERLARVLTSVPIRKPMSGEIDLSSGFGVRTDPFLGRPAMHTGLDFRGDIGTPVRATATGTIESAGRSGGYGNMVEINHGNGLSTRYGHLSKIDVKVGQHVKIGQIIGHVGSTGRSTGPHLHYETRINGEAVDPQKFLRAGLRVRSAL